MNYYEHWNTLEPATDAKGHQLKALLFPQDYRLFTFKGFFKKRFYLFTFRQWKWGRKGEKHQCVVASYVPPTGEPGSKPRHMPCWESNPLVCRLVLNPMSHISQGCRLNLTLIYDSMISSYIDASMESSSFFILFSGTKFLLNISQYYITLDPPTSSPANT